MNRLPLCSLSCTICMIHVCWQHFLITSSSELYFIQSCFTSPPPTEGEEEETNLAIGHIVGPEYNLLKEDLETDILLLFILVSPYV